jgi:hypothetical protein
MIPSTCSKVMTWEQLQSSLNSTRGTVHLFVGTGRSPSKNTFMTSAYTYNPNTKHQGLTSLFLFDSASYLTFVATLSRSCRPSAVASAFDVVAYRQCLCLEDLWRRRRLPTSLIDNIFVLRTFGEEEDPQQRWGQRLYCRFQMKSSGVAGPTSKHG